MFSRRGRRSILWGPATTSIATILLTLSGLLVDEGWLWIWTIILPSAGFIIAHSVVVAVRDVSLSGSLARNYDRAVRGVIELLYNLGDLTAFDLWMIDVYLPIRRLKATAGWPFVTVRRSLSRQLSVSLLETRHRPPLLDIDSGPHGVCFLDEKPLLWFDERYLVAPPASIHNMWASLDLADNAALGKTYGMLSVSPLVDGNNMNCVGVLAVHVTSERHKASYAHGALCSDKGLGYIRQTSEHLNGLLTR